MSNQATNVINAQEYPTVSEYMINQVQQQESGLDSPGSKDGFRGLQPTAEGQHVGDGATKYAVT